MAAPGCESSEISSSLSLSSTEDFDRVCDPCLSTGQKVKAHTYCLECQKYLCKNCSDCHVKTRPSTSHQITDKDNIGKHICSTALNTPGKKKTFSKLTHIGDIHVRTKSDKADCWITCCAVLSSDKLVLADYDNKKLKVVNTHSKSVIEEKSFDSLPWDIAVLPQDQIAVTMLDKREVLIMTTGILSTVCKIPVKGECRGITYHQDHLYVVCVDPLCVLILDKQSKEQSKISLTSKNFSNPHYIVLSENSKLIYISDFNKNCVTSITLQGVVTAVYDLSRPMGMLMLDDGSLFVCRWNGIIQHISGDLKQGQTATGGLQYPWSICYNHQNEFYIGSVLCDQVKVLRPQ